MTQALQNFCRCFSIFIITSLIIGCTSLELENGDWADVEEKPSQQQDTTSPINDGPGQIEQIKTGTFSGEEFEQSAADKPSPEKEELLLYAVSAYLDELNLQKASQLLELTNQSQLPEPLYLRQQVLYAALYIKQNNKDQAHALIENLKDADSTDEVFNDWLQLAQTQLNLDESDFLGSLDLLSNNLNTENQTTLESQKQAIWLFIRGQTLQTLETARQQTSQTDLLGWIELGIVDKKRGQIENDLWQQSSQSWRTSYTGHPASSIHENLSSQAYTSLDESEVRSSGSIALLLPITSPYAEIAQVIRDGFLAASAEHQTSVRVFDTGSGTENLVPIYQQAILEGAQIIIGPLGKAANNHLAQADVLVKPTILLGNVISTDEETRLSPLAYMFSLDPEQEAESLVKKAYNRGYTRAAILYPDSIRGKRLNTAFAQNWRQLGGTITTSIVYPNDLYDAQEPVERVFSSGSAADILFLASNSQQGRLIAQRISKAQPDLTIFATSSIYSGQPEPTRDFFLNNVIFSDMPWMIEGFSQAQYKKQQLSNDEQTTSNSLSRFFAYGVDAFTLALRLPQFMDQPRSSVTGVTGTIELNNQQFLLNRPLIQFVDGIPVPIN